MSQVKRRVFSFCALLMISFSFCFASQLEMNDINDVFVLTKVYVSQENIFFQDGKLLIYDGQNFLFVKTIHQDSEGIYYYAYVYGCCPYGHPYTEDGGCVGWDCPFN